jgi:hypothetical protein
MSQPKPLIVSQGRSKVGSQNRTLLLPESGKSDQRKSTHPHVRALTCDFFGVGEGTRTPGPQDHNLVL